MNGEVRRIPRKIAEGRRGRRKEDKHEKKGGDKGGLYGILRAQRDLIK